MTTYLSARQRAAPPMDRRSTRRGLASGGRDTASPRTLAPGIDNDVARYPGTVNDTAIVYDRGPYYQHPKYLPPGNAAVNWTAAGPSRAELHMRTALLRTMQGNTRSRYPYLPGSPTGGMHTMLPAGVKRTVRRYVATPQMRPGRQDRLQPGQYAGQTYSQTTRTQGGRVR